MLALTRKKGESIIIGENIEIVVLGIAGDQVKLGIAAPRTIAINRKEIHDQIQAENRKAAISQTLDMAKFTRLIKRREDN
ncbi:MAG: carbon storage regulator CsrA [Defluviitaleaceae bacterium]|nr:carbon storage regulator CsrA [Defluviitaleaceae bacterium]